MAMSKQDYIDQGRADLEKGLPRRIFRADGKHHATNSWQENAYDAGYNAAYKDKVSGSLPKESPDADVNPAGSEAWGEPQGVDHGACAIVMHVQHLREKANKASQVRNESASIRYLRKIGALLTRHADRLAAVGFDTSSEFGVQG